ncbi:PilZ domain-containing protein [Rhizobium subbaraonis]|uniref:PilZ domain-containing protein n=1 Tax=Rhizobium subbaraonis TaxID=908946 RepID=A0A285TZL1_9HYPH|nr:PilZ domain-containing protein [Rhizobium subbaraonis]SOC35019.1 PilZ domain-containing protein [Rhizobium subbaraonis]
MLQIKDMPVRASDRSKVRIFATVKVMHETSRARVVDLSASGMALDMEKPIKILPGQIVTIESEELGRLTATVRWYNNGRVGLQYKLNTNSLAQISSYFRFFHEEVKPVMRR